MFHRLLAVEEALQKLRQVLGGGKTLGTEEVQLRDAVGRVLAEDVAANVDSPPFDRSEVDGYAVRSESTYGAEEDRPVKLRVVGESTVGRLPAVEVGLGEAVAIATGAPIPRGANAVVMIEYTKEESRAMLIHRSVVAGENVSQTGSDVMFGDVTLRRGIVISPREVGVLAAIGYSGVSVYKQPRVAVFSTGDELVSVTSKLEPGMVFDINGPTITAMLNEAGALADYLGILTDDFESLKKKIADAISHYDVVVTSGSTSAGRGDMIYKVFDSLGEPGMIVHGLRIRPGKPTVAAVARGKLIVGLPGFPVSAMMALSAIVRPLITEMLGLRETDARPAISAKLAFRVETGRGARHFIPISLVESQNAFAAYPLFGGSGAISTMSLADGYLEVPENREFVDEGEDVEVKLFSRQLKITGLNIIGSHCPGIDLILELSGRSDAKLVNVGSTAGWLAVKKGEADIAGTHLLDEATMSYNVTFMEKYGLRGKAILVRGYSRRQGFLLPNGNPKHIEGFKDLLRDDVMFINRNTGSGTRTFIDFHLMRLDPKASEHVRGYTHEAKTHSAVAAAVAHGRADVGVAIEAFAKAYNLGFILLGEEIFDFVIPRNKITKPAVEEFLRALAGRTFAKELPSRLLGYATLPETGKIIAQ